MEIKVFLDFGVRFFSVDSFEGLKYLLNELDDPDYEYV